MYLPADMCMFDSIVSTCVTDVQCSWCIYLLTRVCLTASSVPVWLMCSAADVSTCWHVYVWQHRQYLVQKGCMLCGVKGFDNYPDYVYHIDSDDHKQVLSCFWCCWCRWLTPSCSILASDNWHKGCSAENGIQKTSYSVIVIHRWSCFGRLNLD